MVRQQIARRWQIGMLAGGHMMADFYGSILLSIAPFLAISMGLTLTELGFMASLTSIITSFMQPFFGHIVDKVRTRFLLSFSIAAAAVFACLIGIFPSYLMIISLSMLAGMAVSLYHPIGSQLAGELSPGKEGWAMSIFSLGGNIGLTIAPLVAMPAIELFGLKGLLLLAVPGLIFAGILQLTHFLPRACSVEDNSHLTEALHKLHAASGGVFRLIVRLNIVTGLRAWTNNALIIFVPTMYVLMGHSKIESARLLTLFFAAGVLGGLFAGWIADRCPKKKVLFAANLLSMFFVAGFVFSHGILAVIFWTLAGATLQGITPVTVVMAQRYLPANAAMASGMMMGLTFGVGSLGALLTGVLADISSLTNALMMLIPLMAISALLTLALPEPLSRQ